MSTIFIWKHLIGPHNSTHLEVGTGVTGKFPKYFTDNRRIAALFVIFLPAQLPPSFEKVSGLFSRCLRHANGAIEMCAAPFLAL